VSPNNTQADDQNQSLPRAIPKLRTRQRVMRPRCARRLTPFSLSGSGVQCANFFIGGNLSPPNGERACPERSRGTGVRGKQWKIKRLLTRAPPPAMPAREKNQATKILKRTQFWLSIGSGITLVPQPSRQLVLNILWYSICRKYEPRTLNPEHIFNLTPAGLIRPCQML
jgi:hypothetical protein